MVVVINGSLKVAKLPARFQRSPKPTTPSYNVMIKQSAPIRRKYSRTLANCHSLTFVQLQSTPVKQHIWQATHKKAPCAVDTSPPLNLCPGLQLPTKMAPSNLVKN